MARIEYYKVRDVKVPSRATKDDAGVDWYVPNVKCEFNEKGEIFYSLESKKFLNALKDINAGRNIQYVEPFDRETPFKFVIGPHERILIPAGIKVRMVRNFWQKILYKILGFGDALNAENKSGIANKKGLIIGSKVVDYGYRGEVHLSVINSTDKEVTIEAGDKLVQFIHYPVVISDYSEISKECYEQLPSTERGEGGFGHSGTK